MRKLSVILLISTLVGCSAMDTVGDVAGLVSGNKEAPTLSVEAQVGDREANVGTTDNSVINAEDNEGVLTVTSNKSGKQFNDSKSVVIKESNTFKELFLYAVGLIGWLLPSPSEMYREMKSWFSRPIK